MVQLIYEKGSKRICNEANNLLDGVEKSEQLQAKK